MKTKSVFLSGFSTTPTSTEAWHVVKVGSAGKCHMWRHKIRLKRRIATKSGNGNQPLNIKTTVELPISKLGLPNFRWSFYFILLLVAFLLFRRIFMTSHMIYSSPSSFFFIIFCLYNIWFQCINWLYCVAPQHLHVLVTKFYQLWIIYHLENIFVGSEIR